VAQEPARQPAQSTAKSVTITGCVQNAPQARAGETRDTSDIKFVLTNAAMSPSGPTGTSGSTTPSTAAASQYRLDADDAKLTSHVGHKVEITGTVEQPTATTQPPAASAANAPKLKVDNVKMIASSCP
jgi:UDP-N-acetylmuramyl tripeptide synthase